MTRRIGIEPILKVLKTLVLTIKLPSFTIIITQGFEPGLNRLKV